MYLGDRLFERFMRSYVCANKQFKRTQTLTHKRSHNSMCVQPICDGVPQFMYAASAGDYTKAASQRNVHNISSYMVVGCSRPKSALSLMSLSF